MPTVNYDEPPGDFLGNYPVDDMSVEVANKDCRDCKHWIPGWMCARLKIGKNGALVWTDPSYGPLLRHLFVRTGFRCVLFKDDDRRFRPSPAGTIFSEDTLWHISCRVEEGDNELFKLFAIASGNMQAVFTLCDWLNEQWAQALAHCRSTCVSLGRGRQTYKGRHDLKSQEMQGMTPIKNCPFCSSGKVGLTGEEFGKSSAPLFVTCYECEAAGPHSALRAEAIQMWNALKGRKSDVTQGEMERGRSHVEREE